MKRLLVVTLVSLTIINFVSCSGSKNNANNEGVTNSPEVVEEIKFTEEEISEFKKAYSEIEALKCWDLLLKYEKVSDEEKEKVKKDYERLSAERERIIADENKAKEEKQEVEKEVIPRENIIGTSNKDFKDIDTSKLSLVTNDTTGNWKLSRVATTENILEYTKSYYENNFSNDKEIHAIVNFTLNTTTKVSKMTDNILSVTVHEYVDKEEHDANKLFGGMVLADYFVYLDNGDIEEIK